MSVLYYIRPGFRKRQAKDAYVLLIRCTRIIGVFLMFVKSCSFFDAHISRYCNFAGLSPSI